MKRAFTEKAHSSRRLLPEWLARPDARRCVLGGLLVAALLAGNLAACLAPERLGADERDVREQPPQTRWLQRLLYRPSSAAWNDPPPGYTGPVIVSHPLHTAVAGEPYAYEVVVEPPDANLFVDLDEGPGGMLVEERDGAWLVTWTPTEDEVRDQPRQGYTVTVAAVHELGDTVRQSYQVWASLERHPWGTDLDGRDMRTALVLATRWTLLPGLVMVLVGSLLGLLFGGLGGYYGGRLDQAMRYVENVVTAIPFLFLIFLAAVSVYALPGSYKLYPVMVCVGIVWFPRVAEVVRGMVRRLKARQFVEASRELGLRDAEILWRDVIWYNARTLLLTQISYGFAFAILVEVTLSYLNLGIKEPYVSWGLMLFKGRTGMGLEGAYWLAFFPAAAVVTTILGFYLLGDGINLLNRKRD